MFVDIEPIFKKNGLFCFLSGEEHISVKILLLKNVTKSIYFIVQLV
jgi:hypothetical protein